MRRVKRIEPYTSQRAQASALVVRSDSSDSVELSTTSKGLVEQLMPLAHWIIDHVSDERLMLSTLVAGVVVIVVAVVVADVVVVTWSSFYALPVRGLSSASLKCCDHQEHAVSMLFRYVCFLLAHSESFACRQR